MPYFKMLLTLLCFFWLVCVHAQQEKYHRVEIHLSKQNSIETLQALGLSLDCGGHLHLNEEENHLEEAIYVAELSDSELEMTHKAGFKTKILQANTSGFYAKRIAVNPVKSVADFKSQKNNDWGLGKENPYYTIPENFEMGSMGAYLTYEEMLFHLDQMHELYPNLISAKTPISNNLLTYEGRPLYWLKISDFPTLDEEEPEVLYTGLHHAREPMSAMQLIYFMYYLLENYDTDSKIQDLVNNRELYFVPCINPDGYVYNQTTNPEGGGLWRKNRKLHSDGNNGVDLNRNYGYEWGYTDSGSSPNTTSNTYRGEAPFSEAETQLMKMFCEAHQFKIGLNYHAYGSYLIYPWGYESNTYTEDHDFFQQMCRRTGWHNNYIYGTVSEALSYLANGDSDDWMYGEETTKNKIFAITPEVGRSTDGFWPSPDRIVPLCQENVWSNLQYAYMAGNYAVARDASEKILKETEGVLKVKLQKLGLEENGIFTLQIQPISSNLSIVSAPLNTSNLETLSAETLEVDYILSADIQNEEAIEYVVLVNNGDFTLATDTITKWYNSPIDFEDNGENLLEWVSEDWYRSNQQAYSGEYSLADSPYSDYNNFDSTNIVLQQEVNLSEASEAKLTFWAKWDIEPHRDFVQVLASKDEGESWTALCGDFTKDGTQYQVEAEPVYDGKQMEWVKEEIDLVDFLGESILLRFWLKTNGNTKADGFYFDDLKVVSRTGFLVDLKLILEGAYNVNTGEMNTFLRDKNLLPLSQPFNVSPWEYEGTEYVEDAAIPSNVVDWVLIELRNEVDTGLVAQKAAWLMSDGKVMDVSGQKGVFFEGVESSEAYFVLVRHRNHLDVMGATAITFSNMYDFTLATNQAAGIGQLTAITENLFALKGGDVDGNGIVSIEDFNAYRTQSAFLNEYIEGDLSMDGLVSVKDYNVYRLHSSALGIPIVRYE
ncbi:MAG: M14 family zinc carboxypeptidase [Chitinophagales bacterium]